MGIFLFRFDVNIQDFQFTVLKEEVVSAVRVGASPSLDERLSGPGATRWRIVERQHDGLFAFRTAWEGSGRN